MSLADETFLDVAVERRFISDKVRRHVINLQKKTLKEARYRNVIDISLQESALTPQQAQKVWQDPIVLRRYLEEDRALGNTAFLNSILDRDGMREIYKTQQEHIDMGLFIRLGDLMLADNIIDIEQYKTMMTMAIEEVRDRADDMQAEAGVKKKSGGTIFRRFTNMFKRGDAAGPGN